MINTTQLRALAKAAGVDHQTIRRLENAANPGDLPLRVLDRIATALGVPAATLLKTENITGNTIFQRRLGCLLLSPPGITITAIATSLDTSIEAGEQALPVVTEALDEASLTVARNSDTLPIKSAALLSTRAQTRGP